MLISPPSENSREQAWTSYDELIAMQTSSATEKSAYQCRFRVWMMLNDVDLWDENDSLTMAFFLRQPEASSEFLSTSPGRSQFFGARQMLEPLEKRIMLTYLRSRSKIYGVPWIPSIYPFMLAYIPAPWIRHGHQSALPPGGAFTQQLWGHGQRPSCQMPRRDTPLERPTVVLWEELMGNAVCYICSTWRFSRDINMGI